MTAPNVRTWTPHLRLTWGGTLGNPVVEEWSNTVRFFNFQDILPTMAQLEPTCDALVGVIADWVSRADSQISSTAALTYVKLNAVLATGKQRDASTVISDVVPPRAGASATAAIWEQTYALTLRTGASRGRAANGRIFPPVVTAMPQTGTPYCSAAQANTMATSFRDCLDALNDGINVALAAAGFSNPSFTAGVVSPGESEKGTAPMRRVFTTVVVDRVADVQHRRTYQVPRLEGNPAPIAP